MPEPLSLISSTDIKQKEFTTFLEKSGVVLHPHDLYDGRLSKGNLHVWIVIYDSSQQVYSPNELLELCENS